MCPLYGIKMPPIPSRCSTVPIKILCVKILNPSYVQNSSVRADIWDPASTSAVISTSLLQP